MRTTMERRELRRHTASLLASLGNGADEVARRLAAASVKGEPGNPEGCAIAAYLGAVIGGDSRVESVKVSPWRVILHTSLGRRPVTVTLPPGLQSFVQRYDHCAFPELVRTSAPVSESV